jgi:hypothetical protein
MNECVHFGSFSDKKDNCGIFEELCDEPAWKNGCYFSVNEREKLLGKQQGKQEEQDPCKEQGCDDIENCDEICKHRRELHQQGKEEQR